MNSANNSTNQAVAADPPIEDPGIVSGAEDEPHCGRASKESYVIDDQDGLGQKNFAEKLFLLLEMDEYQDIFHWLPDGEAFCVKDQVAFERRVMSKYFPSAKFQSFTRRMRRWGFHRIETTEQRTTGLIVFTCPRFKRGRPDLCKRMCDNRQFKAKKKVPAQVGGGAAGLASLADFNANHPAAAATGLYRTGWNAQSHHSALQVGIVPPALGHVMPMGGYYPSHMAGMNPMMADPLGLGGGFGYGNPMYGAAGLVSFPLPSNVHEIRANLDRIEAELAVLSRMRELKQRSLSLAALKNSGNNNRTNL